MPFTSPDDYVHLVAPDHSGAAPEAHWFVFRGDQLLVEIGPPSTAATDDPRGPAAGNERVVRGGSWTSVAGRMRISYRFRMAPAETSVGVGFRCARDAAP